MQLLCDASDTWYLLGIENTHTYPNALESPAFKKRLLRMTSGPHITICPKSNDGWKESHYYVLTSYL